MVQLNTNISLQNQNVNISLKSPEISHNKEIYTSTKATLINQDTVDPKQPATIDDYFLKREIELLAEKIENTNLYTEEASKVLAENILKGAVEFFA